MEIPKQKKNRKGLVKKLMPWMYPITGNLSLNVQRRIARRVGEENYNLENATSTGIVSGLLGYVAVGCSLIIANTEGSSVNQFNAGMGALLGAYGIIYHGSRCICFDMSGGWTFPDLFGKAVSLPWDIYDRFSSKKIILKQEEKMAKDKMYLDIARDLYGF